MFRCTECASTEFELTINPLHQGSVLVETNAHGDVMVSAKGQSFVADLPFMNRFGVCAHCGGIHCWEYFYPESAGDLEEDLAG
ncbi:MAG: hypothetical protein AB7P76_13000 [Candidatus Melainabacteria bacterium]